MSAVFQHLAGGTEDPASKIPLASLLNTIWPGTYHDERDARFINDRVHGNIQKDGTFSVVPEMAGGVCTPAELMRIAQAAVKYNVPLVKMTGGQRIDLVGVRKEDLPGIWRDIGMPAGHAWGKSYRTCKSCIGTDHCRFGLGDSMGLAIRIEKTFRSFSDSPGKMKLATAGCPRNCSEALIKDIGVVAIGDGKWEILVGGAGGAHVRKADLLATVEGEDAVMQIAGRFMQFYREDAKYKERTYTWVPRIGIERIRAVVVDDSEGWGERFDAEIAAAIAAYRDPWKDGEEPKTANQFASLIPVDA